MASPITVDDCKAHLTDMTVEVMQCAMDAYTKDPSNIKALKAALKEAIQIQVIKDTKEISQQDYARFWSPLFDTAKKADDATRGAAMVLVRDGFGVATSLHTGSVPVKIGESATFVFGPT